MLKIRKLFILGLIVFITSCSNDDSFKVESQLNSRAERSTYYSDFGKLLHESTESVELVKFIKEKAEDKIDYDYNILYSFVANEKIGENTFSSYLFNDKFKSSKDVYNKGVNSEDFIKKYPLLNIYVFNIEKLDVNNLKERLPVYVFVPNSTDAYLMKNGEFKRYTKAELEKLIPEEPVLVVSNNERFSVSPNTKISNRYSNTFTYEYIKNCKKDKKDFMIYNMTYKYKNLIYLGKNNISNKNRERTSVGNSSKIIGLHSTKFDSLETYKDAEGWYRGDPEMNIYITIGYLYKDTKINYNNFEMEFSKEYIYRKGFWRKRYLKTAYHYGAMAFTDRVLPAGVDYRDVAAVVHVIEDDGERKDDNVKVKLSIKKIGLTIDYKARLGGTNKDFGKATITLQDLIDKDINVGGFIMDFNLY